MKRRMFREFFRIQNQKNKTYTRLDQYVQEYQQHLHGDDKNISPSLLSSYMQKSFEALMYNFKDKDTSVETPKTVYLDIDEDIKVGLDMDAIFIERGHKNYSHKGKKKSYSTTIINICFLVPPEEWHPITLSNRYDAVLAKKYVYPMLKVEGRKSSLQIVYFCPENGRMFKFSYEDIGPVTPDISRLKHHVEQMRGDIFHKHPSGPRCSECPVLKDCQPKNYQDLHYKSNYSVVLPGLNES